MQRKGKRRMEGAKEREREMPSTASSSRTVEKAYASLSGTTIFVREVFLSLALGVSKGAISSGKKRAVSCRPVAFHDAVSRCTSRTIEKENTRGACARTWTPRVIYIMNAYKDTFIFD